jgi:hypothetical protein
VGTKKLAEMLMELGFERFHSISFPSEWGRRREVEGLQLAAVPCFHSISFPSEWGLLKLPEFPRRKLLYRFPFN